MSSTESRTGFRLPWSSDRSHESPTVDAPVEPATEDAATGSVAWPDSDFNARIGVTPTQPRPVDADAEMPAGEGATMDPATQEPVMLDTAPVVQAPVAPKKASKLMADLSAAIRATADAARDEALAKVDADVAAVVAEVRAGSKEGEVALKQASDDAIVQIREWSKAEIARIKEETDARIEARKALLGEEIADHLAAIERQVGGVEALAASFREDMAAYADRLAREDDPARLATMAESMPEPPDLAQAAPVEAVVEATGDDTMETMASAILGDEPAAAVAPEALEDDAVVAVAPEVLEDEPVAAAPEDGGAGVVAWADQPQIDAQPEAAAEPDDPAVEAEFVAIAEAAPDDAQAADTFVTTENRAGHAGSAWGGEDQYQRSAAAGDDTPRWADGDAPEGFPEPVEGGDPVDRGAIMAALEAAAEAVVAAEAAAESADEAEAAADVAEAAAELVVGRAGPGDEMDPEAQAAFSARVDAGGFETESYADRLASLMPGHEPAGGDGAVRTTQVIVTGLVSVASIASFKRHLGRISGVDGVAVASGPEGEFVFNVTHRADVAFRDAVPTLPGFAARVTSTGEGVVTITARDPEVES